MSLNPTFNFKEIDPRVGMQISKTSLEVQSCCFFSVIFELVSLQNVAKHIYLVIFLSISGLKTTMILVPGLVCLVKKICQPLAVKNDINDIRINKKITEKGGPTLIYKKLRGYFYSSKCDYASEL